MICGESWENGPVFVNYPRDKSAELSLVALLSTEHKKWAILELTPLFSAVTHNENFLEKHWTQTTAQRRVIYLVIFKIQVLIVIFF